MLDRTHHGLHSVGHVRERPFRIAVPVGLLCALNVQSYATFTMIGATAAGKKRRGTLKKGELTWSRCDAIASGEESSIVLVHLCCLTVASVRFLKVVACSAAGEETS